MLTPNLSRVKMGQMAKATKEKEYHHGNLRKAVLKAAFQLVKSRGLKELTLREVARKIGVTHAAPYHHFKNREVLIEAMADESFEELDAALLRAKEGVCDPTQRLMVLGRGYIDFARSRPERLEVMFRRKGMRDPNEMTASCLRAFQHLVDAVVECQRAGVAPQGDPMLMTISAWSLVHGFAMLWVEGPLGEMPQVEQQFEAMRDALVKNHAEWWRAAARSGT